MGGDREAQQCQWLGKLTCLGNRYSGVRRAAKEALKKIAMNT